ncbi:MAG: TIGR01777 family oxidoreductase [Opitutaceae bacterium]
MHDEVFSLSSRIARPAAEVFAWHERPGALQRLCPPWERIELDGAHPGLRDGAQVRVRGKVGPFWSTWRVEHRDYLEGKQFRDVMLSGPFARWEHLHEVIPDGADACVLKDTISYRLPYGALGHAAGAAFTRRKLARMFKWRHDVTCSDLESVARYGRVEPMRVVIAGASGLIGRALDAFLLTQGHEVVRLVRRAAVGDEEITWHPERGEVDPAKLEGADAIVNLAGENLAGGRWTPARRERILRSRVDAARSLVTALAKNSRRPSVFVNAAAVGFYGERGNEPMTEAGGIGHGFLPEVCLAWETHAEGAARLGIRTALMRFGIVLSPAGGALAKMLPAFRFGVGGRFGTGRQWMSWISIDDAVGAIYHALLEKRCSGAINTVSPSAVTNAEFVATLASVLNRPAMIPIPAAGLRVVFGEMADATLLASTRAVPEKLANTGYAFRHPDLSTALVHVLGR